MTGTPPVLIRHYSSTNGESRDHCDPGFFFVSSRRASRLGRWTTESASHAASEPSAAAFFDGVVRGYGEEAGIWLRRHDIRQLHIGASEAGIGGLNRDRNLQVRRDP
jgi:hypothetical protein